MRYLILVLLLSATMNAFAVYVQESKLNNCSIKKAYSQLLACQHRSGETCEQLPKNYNCKYSRHNGVSWYEDVQAKNLHVEQRDAKESARILIKNQAQALRPKIKSPGWSSLTDDEKDRVMRYIFREI